MPDTTLLLNRKTNKYENVSTDEASDKLSSGDYSSTGAVDTRAAGGGHVVREQSALSTAALQGETTAPARQAERTDKRVLEERTAAIRDMDGARALTFSEGVTDSLSMGLSDNPAALVPFGGFFADEVNKSPLRTGDIKEIRQSEFSGFHAAGALTGLAAAALTPEGPGALIAGVMKGGTKAGRLAARAVLGEAKVAGVLRARELAQAAKLGGSEAKLAAAAANGSVGAGARIITRVGEEAGAGAALSGVMAFNHQLSDAIMEDKPFVAEGILHDMKMGGLLGGGLGLLGGGAGSILARASRRDVMAQSGLLDIKSAVSQGVHGDVREGIAGFAHVVDQHEMRLGVLKELANDGHLPKDFMQERAGLVAQAKRAQAKLAEMDMDAALAGTDNQSYLKWRDAMEDYQAKVVALDDAMNPRFVERASRFNPNAPKANIAEGPTPAGPLEDTLGASSRRGEMSVWGNDETPVAFRVDQAMAKGNRLAEYERIYGKPWQNMDDALLQADSEGAGLAGGEVTPTSENSTNAGSPRGRVKVANDLAPSGDTELGSAAGERLPNVGGRPVVPGAEVEEFGARAPGRGHPLNGDTSVGIPGGPAAPLPWKPLAPAAPFNPAEFPDETAAAFGGKTLARTPKGGENVGDFLNGQYKAHELHKLPDGYMQPVSDFRQNAEAFRMFREKAGATGSIEAAPAPARTTIEGRTANDTTTPGQEIVSKGRQRDLESRPFEGSTEHIPRNPEREEHFDRLRKRPYKAEARQAVEKFMDNWFNESMQAGPKVTPADRAAARLGNIMDQIKQATGGALDSAGGAEAMTKLGVRPANTSFGSQIDQIVAARRLGLAAADASRGVKVSNGLLKWAGRRMGGKIVGSAIGGSVGGPLGYVLGAAWGDKLFGFSGRAAGAAGRLVTSVSKAVDGLLSGGRATWGAQALRVTSDPAANTPVAYSDRGPIDDPVQRILEVKRVASNPEAILSQVKKQMGDTALLHPELADHAAKLVQQRMVALSLRAPAVYFDQLGNVQGPATQAMRRWMELENTMNNLDAALEAVGAGKATEAQIDGIRTMHPGVHQRLVTGVLSRPEDLKNLSRSQIKSVENVLGIPLTTSGDPGFVSRQMQAWQLHNSTNMQNQSKNSGAVTPPSPTPAQAAVAPGNE